jgi:sialate O-acetylesterase
MKTSMVIKINTVALLICSCIVSVQADIWMPSIFTNGMILQTGQSVPVWGEAKPGTKVSLKFAQQHKNTVANEHGKWRINLDALKVSAAPRNMTINERTISHILVGEVWFLAGQSNMGWPLKNCDGGPEAAAKANYPWLKIFKQWPYQGASDTLKRDVTGGLWVTCDSKEAAQLSGVGFFFARKLQRSLAKGTPIALINTAMGGTYAESWISSEVLTKTPSAQPMLTKASSEIKAGPADEKGYWGPENYRRPSALFNGKVAPLQPFATRGVLWYQGEGNSQGWLASGYAGTLRALIKSWRQGFEQTELPFLVVQLPRFNAAPNNDWPAIRAAQQKIANEMAAVEIAVTIDLGQKKHIHPRDKAPVGERLAGLACAKVYHQAKPHAGPVFTSVELLSDSAILSFAHHSGLQLRGNGGFEICDENKNFVAAEVSLLADGKIKVFSKNISHPTAVRYAWFNWGEVSLFNDMGLPAAPFTTEI